MDRVLIVTGGSRGIGAATVRLAAQNGYRVCFTFLRDAEAAKAVAAATNSLALPCEVSVEADIIRVFETMDRELGAPYALVNNAATLEQQMHVQEMSADRLHRMFAVNVIGTILCCREAIPRMRAGGAIVNVSSGAAKYGSPGEYVDYAATKGAIDTFTIGLATEVPAQGIRVNGVRPGFIYTDLHAKGGEADRVNRLASSVPMQRGGQPEEVAEGILWLLSDQASYVTGTTLDVSGGR